MAKKITDQITGETVRDDFNAIETVIHYTRAAHSLGLWDSERKLIEKYFSDKATPLLEAGCGAGRVSLALRALGYASLTAFDFADEMIEQARNLAAERGVSDIDFQVADATRLSGFKFQVSVFHGALFLFNGLMQIPGKENRRAALRGLHGLCRPGAVFIFTTHDRDNDPDGRAAWIQAREIWAQNCQDPRLVDFGDRYFSHEHGRTFMHIPSRGEVLTELAATGWTHLEDVLRNELARERRAVLDFSDNCRFWVARRD